MLLLARRDHFIPKTTGIAVLCCLWQIAGLQHAVAQRFERGVTQSYCLGEGGRFTFTGRVGTDIGECFIPHGSRSSESSGGTSGSSRSSEPSGVRPMNQAECDVNHNNDSEWNDFRSGNWDNFVEKARQSIEILEQYRNEPRRATCQSTINQVIGELRCLRERVFVAMRNMLAQESIERDIQYCSTVADPLGMRSLMQWIVNRDAADRYGNIVVDRQSGRAFYTFNAPNAFDALRQDLIRCSRYPNPDCVRVSTFANTCAAMAVAGGRRYVSTATTVGEARSSALRQCSLSNNGCRIQLDICSNPPTPAHVPTPEADEDEGDEEGVHERERVAATRNCATIGGGTAAAATVLPGPGCPQTAAPGSSDSIAALGGQRAPTAAPVPVARPSAAMIASAARASASQPGDPLLCAEVKHQRSGLQYHYYINNNCEFNITVRVNTCNVSFAGRRCERTEPLFVSKKDRSFGGYSSNIPTVAQVCNAATGQCSRR